MGRVVHRDLEWRGKVYATVDDLAAAAGVSTSAVRKAVRAGRIHRIGAGRGFEPMPIRIRGVVYDDVHAVAARFGCSPGAVYQAIHRDQLERFGLPREGGARSRPFEIFGMRWPSEAAACRALGLPHFYLSRMRQKRSEVMMERFRLAAMREKAARTQAERAECQ